MSTANYNNLSIIIPTINEKDNLSALLPILREKYPGASIFISDDGSTDGTYEFIESLIKKDFRARLYLLNRARNEILTNDSTFSKNSFIQDNLKIRNLAGITASVLDTLQIITTDKFAIIDADFQHPPELVGKMYNQLDHADIVTAYREKLKEFAWYRKLLTWAGNFIARSVLPKHSRVRDPLSGAFAGNINRLKKYSSDPTLFGLEGFKVLFDLLKILPSEIKIAQTGYEFGTREKGESKIGWKQLRAFYNSVFDAKTKKLLSGIIILLIILSFGGILLLLFGDIRLSNSIRTAAMENPSLYKAARFLTDYGNWLYYTLFAGFILYGLVRKKKRFLKAGLIYIMVQIIASVLMTGGLKIAIGRPRPGHGFEHHFFTNQSSFKSFPSGHTADAFSSSGVLWGFLSSYLLSSISLLFSLLIGFSRILVGAHYLLDVLAGMAIGFLTGLLIAFKKIQ